MALTIAFLRGINLGKRRIAMAVLKTCFERAGFANAQTVLASGNVIFRGPADGATAAKIETQIEKDFGFTSETTLRRADSLRAMMAEDPFAGHHSGKDTKFYVHFLRQNDADKLTMPCKTEGDYEVVRANAGELFVVAWRLPNGRFGEGQDSLGKLFGREITNRNWNTIGKLVALADKLEG